MGLDGTWVRNARIAAYLIQSFSFSEIAEPRIEEWERETKPEAALAICGDGVEQVP